MGFFLLWIVVDVFGKMEYLGILGVGVFNVIELLVYLLGDVVGILEMFLFLFKKF